MSEATILLEEAMEDLWDDIVHADADGLRRICRDIYEGRIVVGREHYKHARDTIQRQADELREVDVPSIEGAIRFLTPSDVSGGADPLAGGEAGMNPYDHQYRNEDTSCGL